MWFFYTYRVWVRPYTHTRIQRAHHITACEWENGIERSACVYLCLCLNVFFYQFEMCILFSHKSLFSLCSLVLFLCYVCVCVLFFRVSCCVFLHFSLFRVIFSIPCSKHYFHLAWYDSIRSDFMHCSHIWLNLEQVPAFREMICTR